MGPDTARALVLDAGALIAVEHQNRLVLTLFEEAHQAGQPIVIPAGVVGQVWRGRPRQAGIARVIKARGTRVEPLTLLEARLAGQLCGESNARDVIDATVVIAARRHRARVVSSDRSDLERLDPTVPVIDC